MTVHIRPMPDTYREHKKFRPKHAPIFDAPPSREDILVAIELLEELELAGYYLAVATGKTRLGLDRVLAKNALATRFHATRCADEAATGLLHGDARGEAAERVGGNALQQLPVGSTEVGGNLEVEAGLRGTKSGNV